MSVDIALVWGLFIGAGITWVLCWSGLLAGNRQSTSDEGAGEDQYRDDEDPQEESSAQWGAVTVEGLVTAALNSVGSSRARVDIVRNRLGEIRGPLSGRDVTALLEPIGSSNGRMEVFRLLARRVRGTVPDDEYAQILSVLGSRHAAEASKLLKR